MSVTTVTSGAKCVITWHTHEVLPEPVGLWPTDLLSMDGVPVTDAGLSAEMSTTSVELRAALEAVLNAYGTADTCARWADDGDKVDALITESARHEHAVECFRVRRDDDLGLLLVVRVSHVRLTRYERILAAL